MLLCQEILEFDEYKEGYKNLKNIDKRFGMYYEAISIERLPYFLSAKGYHLIIFESFNEQFVNVVMTTDFYYNKRQLFDIGDSNLIFQCPKQYLPMKVDSYIEGGSKMHLYFSKKKGSYCAEKLVPGFTTNELFHKIQDRAYSTTIQGFGSDEKKEEPAKILEFKIKKEYL